MAYKDDWKYGQERWRNSSMGIDRPEWTEKVVEWGGMGKAAATENAVVRNVSHASESLSKGIEKGVRTGGMIALGAAAIAGLALLLRKKPKKEAAEAQARAQLEAQSALAGNMPPVLSADDAAQQTMPAPDMSEADMQVAEASNPAPSDDSQNMQVDEAALSGGTAIEGKYGMDNVDPKEAAPETRGQKIAYGPNSERILKERAGNSISTEGQPTPEDFKKDTFMAKANTNAAADSPSAGPSPA